MSSTNPAAIRPVTLAEIEAARARIADTIVRTPLVRLELGPGFPDIRLKLENLQPINAYKLRGAANAVALLDDAERARGVWTISAGNAGQGVAYAARQAGVPCTVVAIETAPVAKIERMKALGATLIPVPYHVAWKALEDRAYEGAGHGRGDHRHRRRRAHHRRGERGEGAEAVDHSVGIGAGHGRAGGTVVL